MLRKFILSAATVLALGGAALADPIEGGWRTQSGASAMISPCGGGFCIKLVSGKFNGKQIGKMSPSGGNEYSGSITDPEFDKTYSGSASLSGGSLKMTGCAMKIFCKTQTWTKL